jgi:hypothetical protein
MTNTYRALTAAAKAAYDDNVFERDLSATDEKDALDSGLLEVVGRKYKVLSNNYSAGEQGEEIELALLVEVEAALLAGGHLERVDPKPAKKSAAKKKQE